MGLYQKIMVLSEIPKGLLNKAMHLLSAVSIEQELESPVPVSFFEQLSIDCCFTRSLLLVPQNTTYVAADSYGITPNNRSFAHSSRDFWDGTFKSDASFWTIVTNDDLVNYLQLFSPEDRNDIRTLYICRVLDPAKNIDYILLIAENNDKTEIPESVLDSCIHALNDYVPA